MIFRFLKAKLTEKNEVDIDDAKYIGAQNIDIKEACEYLKMLYTMREHKNDVDGCYGNFILSHDTEDGTESHEYTIADIRLSLAIDKICANSVEVYLIDEEY